MQTRMLLVDDHHMILDGLSHIFDSCEDLEVIAKANSGAEAWNVIEKGKVDLVVSDIDMPEVSGLKLLKKVKAHNPGIKFVILSMHSDNQLVREIMRNGADGYLLKTANRDDMLMAIRQVIEGKRFFSSELTESLLQHEEKSELNPNLTEREIEVLKLIAEGMSAKEIGEKLFISDRTVDTHRSNLMKKLDAKNIAALVRYAIKCELLD